mmetsp:Transcript_2855/g.8209  ORF Transcript_2855/g.8209 Transcript_2855/m.8209 type:complete len:294 (-) Transcript_2855:151-1032(-)
MPQAVEIDEHVADLQAPLRDQSAYLGDDAIDGELRRVPRVVRLCPPARPARRQHGHIVECLTVLIANQRCDVFTKGTVEDVTTLVHIVLRQQTQIPWAEVLFEREMLAELRQGCLPAVTRTNQRDSIRPLTIHKTCFQHNATCLRQQRDPGQDVLNNPLGIGGRQQPTLRLPCRGELLRRFGRHKKNFVDVPHKSQIVHHLWRLNCWALLLKVEDERTNIRSSHIRNQLVHCTRKLVWRTTAHPQRVVVKETVLHAHAAVEHVLPHLFDRWDGVDLARGDVRQSGRRHGAVHA